MISMLLDEMAIVFDCLVLAFSELIVSRVMALLDFSWIIEWLVVYKIV